MDTGVNGGGFFTSEDELFTAVLRALGPQAAGRARDAYRLRGQGRDLTASERDELHAVLDPVLADIRAAGAILPVIEEHAWADDEAISVYLWSQDGYYAGVQVLRDQPPAERLAWLADQVQDWEVEELAAAGRPATWPECPQHPGTHPLSAVVLDDVAVWQCPAAGTVAFRVGAAL
jgi:hypothetical protein